MAQEIERTEHLYGTTPRGKLNPIAKSNPDKRQKNFAEELDEQLEEEKKKTKQEDQVIIGEENQEHLQEEKADQKQPEQSSDENDDTDDSEIDQDGHIDLKA